MPSKRSLRLIEIQESVLPEDEWIIGISDLSYFNGVGFSMPLASGRTLGLDHDSSIHGGGTSFGTEASSNLDDPIKLAPIETGPHDSLLPLSYVHNEESLQASNDDGTIGPSLSSISENILLARIEQDVDLNPNLYAFIPGIFYCSNQQTSVDAILIEVTQETRFGIALSSFRPEDVRSFDVSQAVISSGPSSIKTAPVSEAVLGGFKIDSYLQESITPQAAANYNPSVEIGIALAKQIRLSMLKQAYIATDFMEERLSRFSDDIEFFGLRPRNRVYVKNRKHPYGTIVDVSYRGLVGILELHGATGMACPDEVDLEIELGTLSFSRTAGSLTEVDIEEAVLDMLAFIEAQLEGRTDRRSLLQALFREGRP